MKKFNKELNGYNKAEVNAFLSDVIMQTEKAIEKLNKQQAEIRTLKEQLIHYQDLERSLNLALNNAQDAGENIRREARNEANIIINEAKRNANTIVNDALIRSEKIELKNENMERNLRIFKKRLRTIVEQQLEVVEEIEQLEIED